MQTKTKIHDGIVGVIMLAGIVLGLKVDARWLYLPGVVSVLMISSAFTGFCPVYFVLNKLMPATEAGK